MIVFGNVIPKPVHLEPYSPRPSVWEVRLRENVEALPEPDLYRYDEYLLYLPNGTEWEQEIHAHMEAWMAVGRMMEENCAISTICRCLK